MGIWLPKEKLKQNGDLSTKCVECLGVVKIKGKTFFFVPLPLLFKPLQLVALKLADIQFASLLLLMESLSMYRHITFQKSFSCF